MGEKRKDKVTGAVGGALAARAEAGGAGAQGRGPETGSHED